jgi:hypothetical protein
MSQRRVDDVKKAVTYVTPIEWTEHGNVRKGSGLARGADPYGAPVFYAIRGPTRSDPRYNAFVIDEVYHHEFLLELTPDFEEAKAACQACADRTAGAVKRPKRRR